MKERKIFEIIKHLNRILAELRPEKDVLLSIVDLRLPEKGGALKIWLSVFPKEKELSVLNYIRKNQKKIKSRLKELRLRYLPQKIEVFPSSALQEANEVLTILKNLKNEIEKEEKATKD